MLVVDFYLKPSRIYLILFSLLAYTTIVILVTLPLPLWLRLISATIVLVHSARVIWRYALLKASTAIKAIRYTAEKQWVIETNEATYAARLLGNSVVTNFAMLLHFRIAGRMLPLKSIIFQDSVTKEQYRQLLVILRTTQQN